MNLRHEEKPVAEASQKCEAIGSDTERVSGCGVKADLLEEIGRCISETETTDELAAEDDAGDFCAASFETLKAVPVAGTNGELLFEVVGVHDRREGVLGIDVARLALETTEGLLGVVESVVANQVVWRLRCKRDNGDQEQRPEPLNREGDPISPLVCSVNQATENTSRDELADDEAHVGV